MYNIRGYWKWVSLLIGWMGYGINYSCNIYNNRLYNWLNSWWGVSEVNENRNWSIKTYGGIQGTM